MAAAAGARNDGQLLRFDRAVGFPSTPHNPNLYLPARSQAAAKVELGEFQLRRPGNDSSVPRTKRRPSVALGPQRKRKGPGAYAVTRQGWGAQRCCV